MTNNDKTFNPNSLNDYKMTHLEVAIQSGEAQLIRDVANHPDFDYKQHRPSMFLQILENSSTTYHSPKKLEETKIALKEVLLAAIEKDPQNLGHYTPGFLRDDSEVVMKAVEKDVSAVKHASIRLREDKEINSFIRHKVISSDKLVFPDEQSKEPWYFDKEVMGISKKHSVERIKSTRETLNATNETDNKNKP